MGQQRIPENGWKIFNFKQTPDPITMGWEYEIDTKDERFRNIENDLDSLGPNFSWCFENISDYDGYEIKSPIAPLRIVKLMKKRFLPLIEKYHKSYVDKKYNGGGIHINISKNTFTNKHKKSVFDFLHNSKYEKFFYKLSHRSEYSFSSYCEQYDDRWIHYQNDHFGIINSQKPQAYEMRLFKALPQLLIPAMEFTDAIYKYSEEINKDLNPENLINYTSQKIKYLEITKLMQKAIK